MSGGFTAQPESFPPSAQQIRQAGQQLAAAWAPVKDQSESVPFGRGDDMVSPLIQVSLQGAIALVDSCVASSAKALAGYADGLQAMGETYTQAEQDTTTMLKPA